MTNLLAKRRRVLQAIMAAPLIVRVPGVAAAGRAVEVWKGPGCGCCNDWIAILERAGFAVTAHDTGNAAARRTAGIDLKFASCHTAIVDGYGLEGHVPVREIVRLLNERPDAIGLAVPGMPIGSPGMEQGTRVEPYTVLLLHRGGTATAYATYG